MKLFFIWLQNFLHQNSVGEEHFKFVEETGAEADGTPNLLMKFLIGKAKDALLKDLYMREKIRHQI